MRTNITIFTSDEDVCRFVVPIDEEIAPQNGGILGWIDFKIGPNSYDEVTIHADVDEFESDLEAVKARLLLFRENIDEELNKLEEIEARLAGKADQLELEGC